MRSCVLLLALGVLAPAGAYVAAPLRSMARAAPLRSMARAQHARRQLPLVTLSLPERKQGILGAWEDVLDYLTNMGGYTGFTEEELKGLQGQNTGQFDKKDM